MTTKPNETSSPVPPTVDDRMLRVFRFIALAVALQTLVVIYLVFGQPAPKLDGKLQTLSNNLMDQEARLVQVERENATLFRMLRNGNEQHGVLPDRNALPVVPVPLPPSPKRIGDMPGDFPGEMPPGAM